MLLNSCIWDPTHCAATDFLLCQPPNIFTRPTVFYSSLQSDQASWQSRRTDQIAEIQASHPCGVVSKLDWLVINRQRKGWNKPPAVVPFLFAKSLSSTQVKIPDSCTDALPTRLLHLWMGFNLCTTKERCSQVFHKIQLLVDVDVVVYFRFKRYPSDVGAKSVQLGIGQI